MHSPMGSYDNNRRRGRGSSSSGGSGIHRYKDIDRNRGSMSRSRSYTGSSSRSASRSRGSRSHSKNRASLVSNRNDSPRARESDFATRSYDDQRSPRNRVHSTSSSRSSEIRLRNSFRSNHKDQNSGFNHGTSNCSPSNFISHPRCYSGSPSMDDRNFSAYTNAVAPDVNGSLVSDLIQPKYQGRQRQKSQTMDRGFNQRSRHSSRSSSIGSVASSENVITMSRNRSPHKRPHSNSSSLNEPVNSGQFRRSQQDDNQNQEAIDSVKRKKIKPTLRQRDSISSDENRIVSRPVSVESIDGERPNLIRPCTPNVDRFIKSTRQEDATQKRRLNTKSIHKIDTVIITEDKNDLKTNSRSPQLSVRRSKRWQPQDHEENETNKTSTNKKSELKKSKRKCPNSEESEKNEIVNQDLIDLIQTRKDALTQDYKRDCEAFTTVVRTLISKDQDLESRLMPMLKEILHERGHRCIDDLRLFIADHQPTDSSAKSTKHLFKDVNNAS